MFVHLKAVLKTRLIVLSGRKPGILPLAVAGGHLYNVQDPSCPSMPLTGLQPSQMLSLLSPAFSVKLYSLHPAPHSVNTVFSPPGSPSRTALGLLLFPNYSVMHFF